MYSNSTNGTCSANPERWGYLLLLPIPLVAGVVNLTVGLAATFYRRKLLRQSYVYIAVTSTLLSNILFLCIHLWEEIAHYRIPDAGVEMKPDEHLGILWTLCTSAWIALLSAVCGNLSVLIYVMVDSTSFQNSLRHPVVTSSSAKCKSNYDLKATELQRKRRRAMFLLVFTWLLPLGLTIGAVLGWNCAKHCSCSLSALGEVCPQNMGCSKVWPPLTNSFMAVNVGIWLVEVIALLSVSATRFRRAMWDSDPGRAPSTSTSRPLPLSSSGMKASITSNGADKFARADSTREGSDDVFRSSRSRFRMSMNPRLKLVAYLSALFIVCTVLIPITFFIDIHSSSSFSMLGLRFASTALIQVYALVCPLLLVRYLSGLKLALVKMSTAMQVCCKVRT